MRRRSSHMTDEITRAKPVSRVARVIAVYMTIMPANATGVAVGHIPPVCLECGRLHID